MKKITLATALIGSLLLATGAQAANAQPASHTHDNIPTLPTVQVRPDVGWVGTPDNERIVTLATVEVRPDAFTRLQAAALDAVALLPSIEAIQVHPMNLELPVLRPLSYSLPASVRGP